MRDDIEHQDQFGHSEVRGDVAEAAGAGRGGCVSLGVLEPVRRHPLRLALQAVDLVQQLLVGTLGVVIYDYHVEQVAPS